MQHEKEATIRAVIFDLDGTLLYTLPDIARAINTVLRSRGFPEHREEEYRQLVGHGLRESVKNALPPGALEEREPRQGEELVDRLAAELVEEYHRDPAGRTVPYEGIPELLEHLAARGVPAAVLTNKRQEIAREVLRRVLPEHPFREVLGDGGDFPRKPDTASSLYLAERFVLQPQEVLFLGDSGVDMETAAAAGMRPGGVLWGYKGREELERAGARYLFSRPAEVRAVLEG
jgi:phosphoglycolate phosphatase